jgi:glutamate synthase (NADPH/NADH) small chain
MGKVTGFMEYTRALPTRRPPEERIKDYFEIYEPFPKESLQEQGARCMDCGIPFCHTGCPVNNIIPDWNDMVYRGRWKEAIRTLHATNNFPEFTGRICPAPCEASCVLGINETPVTIKMIEKSIIEHAFEQGWILPEPPAVRTGKRVAVVGSGPLVTVFEKNDRIGGLLRYGIPDFKLEKHVVDRRLAQMTAEGVVFKPNSHIGGGSTARMPVEELRKEFDAILLAGGAEQARDLPVPGRELAGIHFAMEFLPQQNKRNAGDNPGDALATQITATGKRVVILGGGDTGADCLGTCHRQGAASVHQFEIMPKPPEMRAGSTPWPLWPMQLRTESSHEEGGIRDWCISTVRFEGNGKVEHLVATRVGPAPKFEAIPGSEFTIDADLVLFALGFVGPVRNGMVEQLGVKLDARGNVSTDEHSMTSVPGVFAAGDMRRGQSLVVWAIAEGRRAAEGITGFLAS